MAIGALYDQKCSSPICWSEMRETELLGLELVQLTIEKVKLIREIVKIAQSRQKSYGHKQKRLLEFDKM